MITTYSTIFRAALGIFPHEFRERFADEMALVFAERCGERPALHRPLFVLSEIVSVIITGARFRIAGHSRQQAMKAAVVLAMLATTLTMRQASPVPAARIDFNGRDPAGVFTITVVNGKAIAATLDRVPVAVSKIVQKGENISIVGDDGGVALAVAFDASRGEISWKARR